MNSFFEKETALLERWYNKYSIEERDYFCYDGMSLLWNKCLFVLIQEASLLITN